MVVPLNPHQLPATTDRLVRQDGTPTTLFYYFLHSLFQRGGGPSGIPNSAGAAIAAAGTDQGTATQLIHDYTEVTNGSGGVRMTVEQPGQQHRVYNGLSGNLEIFPPPGGQIDGLGVDQPYVLGTGKSQQIWASSIMSNGGTQYRSITLG